MGLLRVLDQRADDLMRRVWALVSPPGLNPAALTGLGVRFPHPPLFFLP